MGAAQIYVFVPLSIYLCGLLWSLLKRGMQQAPVADAQVRMQQARGSAFNQVLWSLSCIQQAAAASLVTDSAAGPTSSSEPMPLP